MLARVHNFIQCVEPFLQCCQRASQLPFAGPMEDMTHFFMMYDVVI